MTYSGKRAAGSVRIMEGEFSMFCRLSAELSAIIQRPNICQVGGMSIHEIRDELDILSDYTDWPAMRRSTRSTIERIDDFLVDQPMVVFA